MSENTLLLHIYQDDDTREGKEKRREKRRKEEGETGEVVVLSTDAQKCADDFCSMSRRRFLIRWNKTKCSKEQNEYFIRQMKCVCYFEKRVSPLIPAAEFHFKFNDRAVQFSSVAGQTRRFHLFYIARAVLMIQTEEVEEQVNEDRSISVGVGAQRHELANIPL